MGMQSSCLWAYAITSTLVAIIFVCLYSTCGSEQDIVAGDEKKIVKYDILTLDQSETADDIEGCTCLSSFTILELIVITLIGLGLIVLLIKMLLKGKKKYNKRKEKLAAEMAKRELKQQQEIRESIMSEMAGTSGIKVLSAKRGEETADSVQVEMLPGPIKQDTVKFP